MCYVGCSGGICNFERMSMCRGLRNSEMKRRRVLHSQSLTSSRFLADARKAWCSSSWWQEQLPTYALTPGTIACGRPRHTTGRDVGRWHESRRSDTSPLSLRLKLMRACCPIWRYRQRQVNLSPSTTWLDSLPHRDLICHKSAVMAVRLCSNKLLRLGGRDPRVVV